MEKSGVLGIVGTGHITRNRTIGDCTAGIQIGAFRIPGKENKTAAVPVTSCPPIGSVPIAIAAVEIDQQIVDEIDDIDVLQRGGVILVGRKVF